jgi:cyclohexadienyl dehydratase
MKFKILPFIFLIILFVTGNGFAQNKSRLHRILESGILRVGTTGDWNPMTVRDPKTNSYKGFDIDVMRELAKDLDVKIKFIPTAWKTLINGIIADKYDISTSASITPKRIRSVGFTKSYYQVVTVPMTNKRNLSRFKDWEDINNSEVIVAVTLGTSQEQQVKKFFPKANIRLIEAPARDYHEVLSGRAHVSVTSSLEASRLIKSHPQLAIVSVTRPRSPADLAFIVPQDDFVWINFMNHWIAIKQNIAFFENVKAKWLMSY